MANSPPDPGSSPDPFHEGQTDGPEAWSDSPLDFPTVSPLPEMGQPTPTLQKSSAKELLTGESSNEILARIWDDDPLDVARLIPKEIDKLGIIIDAERVRFRALARCAYKSALMGFCGDAMLDSFLRARIIESVEDLMDEDWSEERQNLPVDPLDDRYRSIIEGADLTANQARRIALTFNSLEDEVRYPLYAVLVKNREVMEVAREFKIHAEKLKAMIFSVLTSFDVGPEDAKF